MVVRNLAAGAFGLASFVATLLRGQSLISEANGTQVPLEQTTISLGIFCVCIMGVASFVMWIMNDKSDKEKRLALMEQKVTDMHSDMIEMKSDIKDLKRLGYSALEDKQE